MSRRQRTILVLELRTPLPPGWTQKKLLEELRSLLSDSAAGSFSPETQVKIVGREVTYL
jgi:hypothetical protein